MELDHRVLRDGRDKGRCFKVEVTLPARKAQPDPKVTVDTFPADTSSRDTPDKQDHKRAEQGHRDLVDAHQSVVHRVHVALKAPPGHKARPDQHP